MPKQSIFYYNMYHDLSRLVLWSDPTEDGSRATLSFSFRDGNPRILVYMISSDKKADHPPPIHFASDMPSMASILLLLKDIADGPNEDQVTIDSLVHVYENNTKTDKTKVNSKLVIGKSRTGTVYMALLSSDRPKFVFSIQPSKYTIFKSKNNEAISAASISAKMAKGIADLMLGAMSNVITSYSQEAYLTGQRKASPIKGAAAPRTIEDAHSSGASIEDFDDIKL